MQLATDDILGRYSLAQIEAALDRRDQDRLAEESESSLRSFAQLMWPVLHPPTKPLIIGWAFDAIGDATWTLRLLALIPAVIAVVAVIFLKTHQTITESEHLE